MDHCANARAQSYLEAVECVNTESRKCKYIAKCMLLPVRELASVSVRSLDYTLSSYPRSLSADRQLQLAEQVEAAAMRSLDRTQDRHGTGHWPKGGLVWWGSKAAGVCVNVYGICLYARSKFWACFPQSKFPSCFTGQPSSFKWNP